MSEQLPTTCLSDAMAGLNNIDSAIKPLKEEYRLMGRARTVKMPVGDNAVVLKAIQQAQPGEVLVIDAKGDTYRAIAGDFVLGMAQTLGIAGIVVDGVIRDIVGVKKVGLPVFCRGTTVAAGAKYGVGELDVPITCGGVSVQPGDLIVGDADGVVVIPQASEEEVLKKAAERLAKDEAREAKYSGNPQLIRQYLTENIP